MPAFERPVFEYLDYRRYLADHYFENENFTAAQRTVYATCGQSAVMGDDTTYAECAEGLDCIGDRCLEPCMTAADCSLLAFECADGHCRLPE